MNLMEQLIGVMTHYYYLLIYFSSVLTVLEATFQLTLGFHGAIY